MDSLQSTPPTLDTTFRDRQTGLIIGGVVLLLAGGFLALGSLANLFAIFSTARSTEESIALGLTVVVSAIVAAALIWLGIGSINARRWARALILCGSVAALYMGIGVFVFIVLLRTGGAALTWGNVGAFVVFLIVLIGAPAAFLRFYASCDVRRSCETRDPITRWTDRSPLPVIGGCLLIGLSAGSILVLLAQAAFPIGAIFLSGWPARLLWLGTAIVLLQGIPGFYRCDRQAWNRIMFTIIMVVSLYLVTLFIAGQAAQYQAMGLSEQQIAQIMRLPAWPMAIYRVLATVLTLGYLFWLQRFFRCSRAAN